MNSTSFSTLDLTQLIAHLTAGKAADVGYPAILPPGYTLADTERFRPFPERWRHTFKTTSLDAFLSYLRLHSVPASILTVDPDHLTASAILDHGLDGDPQWGDHRAQLTLEPTPLYKAIIALCNNQPRTQEELIDWLLDWAPYLTFSATGPETDRWTDLPFPAALAALRRLQVKTGTDQTRDVGDVSTSKSLLASAAITSDPPRAIRVVASPYEELEPYTMTLRLTYLPQDPPRIRARLQEAATLQRAFAQELVQRINDGGVDIPTYIGRLDKH